MKKANKIINGLCLYTPDGAAREYAAVGCNFYRGCPYQCSYCYNRKGPTAKVLGLPYAVLEDKFTKENRRPKKYSSLSGEEYAYLRFRQEVTKWRDQLLKTGIFFSFTSDPLCCEAFDLTWKCVLYAVKEGVPVKILTKNADFTPYDMQKISAVTPEKRSLIAFGYTLTGRDDVEPYASNNAERILMMRILHEMGFRIFASIEPIVDFPNSLSMVKKSIHFCDQYLIGLMSKRSKDFPPYDKEECRKFIYNVDLAVSSSKIRDKVRIYWKESIRKYMSDDDFSMYIVNHSSFSVGSRWSLFTEKDISIDED